MPLYSPRMLTVTLTASGTVYQLATLLAAADPDLGRLSVMRAQQLSLQVDKGAGAANVQVGNADITSTNFGFNLVATQMLSFPSMSANLIRLDNIYLLSDTNSVAIHVALLTR